MCEPEEIQSAFKWLESQPCLMVYFRANGTVDIRLPLRGCRGGFKPAVNGRSLVEAVKKARSQHERDTR